MASSRKEGIGCYLDGVQVKVSEKFRPPRRIILPVGLTRNFYPQSLQENYDFDLELKTIEFAERYRREQESKRQAQTERVAADIEQFTQLAGKEQSAVSDTSPGSATSRPPAVVSAAAAAPSSILQPAQASEAAGTAAKRSTAEKSFSLAEFENDASSPFDYVELQTINDLEELSCVFQGMNVQSPGAASGEPEAPAGVPAWEAPELSEACVVNHNDTGASVHFSRSAADVGSLGDQKVAEHQTVSPSAGLSPRSEPTPQQGARPQQQQQQQQKPERALGAQAPAEVIPPLLRSLMDMGFDKHRAQRALQSQGSSDDKKVIEYLCQVQSLVDAGFSDMDAEEALRLNPDGYQQALEFLQLQKQFLALGFERDAIAKALVQAQNDRDKALDSLLG